ncbi:hypothetical protein Pth03_44820 [Planotetraspora thailandica]|uniref:Uncharacterized protein n=1 Tax=Planotetraspora thailandica TaxID=487172 RepID=A0A8J3V3G6_9ACTN|nr:hypothetical protein [Planotetraspora thailandica]GII56093.1 hypothetical protein Pth03_44820 [Planotetraspora thailandica]
MIDYAYERLSQQRYKEPEEAIAAAAEALEAIAITMQEGEESGHHAMYASYARLHQEALEGLAELRSWYEPELGLGRRAVGTVPDLADVSKLGGLICDVLLNIATQGADSDAQLNLLNAAARAARLRDLLAS